jgi:hypothetical protein
MSRNLKVCTTCSKEFSEEMRFCLNCGSVLKSKDKIINCEFEFKCPLSWENLQKLENNDVRFCSSCEKNVYFAQSQNELDKLANEGKCVAFNPHPQPDVLEEIPRMMGMVVPPEMPPPPPVLMGMPVTPKKEEKKKSRWKFWK